MDKTYVVATRNAERASDEWLKRLRGIPGVRLRSGTSDQALVVADERGIARLKTALGRDFLIEEQVLRTPEKGNPQSQ